MRPGITPSPSEGSRSLERRPGSEPAILMASMSRPARHLRNRVVPWVVTRATQVVVRLIRGIDSDPLHDVYRLPEGLETSRGGQLTPNRTRQDDKMSQLDAPIPSSLDISDGAALMRLDSNRYALLFDLHGRTDLPKDGFPAYDEIVWTM
jgi:hypothetical protein